MVPCLFQVGRICRRYVFWQPDFIETPSADLDKSQAKVLYLLISVVTCDGGKSIWDHVLGLFEVMLHENHTKPWTIFAVRTLVVPSLQVCYLRSYHHGSHHLPVTQNCHPQLSRT